MRKSACFILFLFLVSGCGQPSHHLAGVTNPLPEVTPGPAQSPSTPAPTYVPELSAAPSTPASLKTVSSEAPVPKPDPSTTPGPLPMSSPQETHVPEAAPTGKINESSNMVTDFWNHQPSVTDPHQNVVLTFDDGPSPYTSGLIKMLDQEKVPAVFFWLSGNLGDVNKEVMKLLNNSPNIAIGDHTINHPNLLKLDEEAQRREIVGAKDQLEKMLGRPVQYFRPPYGNYNKTTAKVLYDASLTPVMWGDDSLDWKYQDDTATILKNIKSELHPGAIILMHDRKNTVKYLPEVLKLLRDEGYSFSTFAK